MLKRLIRPFSQYRTPQSFKDYVGTNIKKAPKLQEASMESMNRTSLTFRNVELEDYDFETDTSDFDVERFDLKEYLWTLVYYRDRTWFRVTLFVLTASCIVLASKMIYSLFRYFKRMSSPIQYFGLLEPAFRDIELERSKQRLKFSVLHSYD